ncbi:hypothetical protein VKT23_003411 [Stygiomarasmius scandens]|uniref:Heterokaryon incompatibility domain-containing protein n=1 Tax=Marasmiellus scandens TaxID=2682957 RepID=A0ABR1JX36_9AGAR
MRLLHIDSFQSVGTPPDTSATFAPAAPFSSPTASFNTELEIDIVEFQRDIPPYAILSHTWVDEEVSFQDIQHPEVAQVKKGYTKIIRACHLARQQKLHYIWIDSCCINKDSSAELSEALNSMYRYYADSAVCYVYLSDVLSDDPRKVNSMFRSCKWFTRGWTLQELLAPSELVFYDSNWKKIGTKLSLHDIITSRTGIPAKVLFGDYSDISIARKMSWAARRQTTRPEDRAYSLMGIFRVSMPVIYGEGLTNAFMHLQREIILSSDDRSIFAWVATLSDSDLDSRGLLARSPFDFRWSRNVGMSGPIVGKDSSFSMTNSGLHIHLPVKDIPSDDGEDFLASLNCRDESSLQQIALYLCKDVHGTYVRCRADCLKLQSGPLPSIEDVREMNVKGGPTNFSGKELRLDVRYSLPSKDWSCIQWFYRDSAWIESSAHSTILTNHDQVLLNVECDDYGFAVVTQISGDTLLTNLVMDLDSSQDPRNGFLESGSLNSRNNRRSVGMYSPGSSVRSNSAGSIHLSPYSRTVAHAHSQSVPMSAAPSSGVHSRVPLSYFRGCRSNTGSVIKDLPGGGLVYMTIHKTSHKPNWKIEIHVSVEKSLVQRELDPPSLGFMVQIKSKLNFCVKEVIPSDLFQEFEDHRFQESYISIEPDINNSNAFRIIVLECSDPCTAPFRFAVKLGIHESKAWAELVYDVGDSESAESISK